VALNGGGNDLLIRFTAPVTSVMVTTDDFGGEDPDIVRLLALSETGNPFEYMILDIGEGLDDAITSRANLLSVDNGGAGFSFALFQTTTEQEGFDDLTFSFAPSVVPEPGGVALFIGLMASDITVLLCHRKRWK
jgi:hypothetical protein